MFNEYTFNNYLDKARKNLAANKLATELSYEELIILTNIELLRKSFLKNEVNKYTKLEMSDILDVFREYFVYRNAITEATKYLFLSDDNSTNVPLEDIYKRLEVLNHSRLQLHTRLT